MGFPTDHDLLVQRCLGCTVCRLRLHRRNAVVFRGVYPSPLMLVGEAPGAEEDEKGLPFVGPSGQLLDRLLHRAGVPSDAFYLCNTVKCRPPNNREPTPEEVAQCRPLLLDQVALVHPRRIVPRGKTATMALTATRGSMGALLDRLDLVCFWAETIPVIPVYHPAYLLRRLDDPSARVEVRDTVARLQRAWQGAPG